MIIPDYLTCFLRNLYAGQEATVKTGHGTTDWFQIGKGLEKTFQAIQTSFFFLLLKGIFFGGAGILLRKTPHPSETRVILTWVILGMKVFTLF